MMRIVIAGGGTGGHLAAGIAIAEALQAARANCEVTLVGTRANVDEPILRRSGFKYLILPARPFPRRLDLSAPGKLAVLAWGLVRALVYLSRRPAVVVGTGGYGSVPLGLAARILGVPLTIHEPDARRGLATRLLARFAHAITCGYPGAAERLRPRVAQATGNPVRRCISEASRRKARAAYHLSPQDRLLLVFGGSQGARTLNGLTLDAAGSLIRRGWRILHLTGRASIDAVTGVAAEKGLKSPHYAACDFLEGEEMGNALAAADLVLCRGGALSIAEIAAHGPYAIIVPYPYASAAHQEGNARLLVEAGRGEIVHDADISPAVLRRRVDALERDGKLGLRKPRSATSAAERIADIVFLHALGGDFAQMTEKGNLPRLKARRPKK